MPNSVIMKEEVIPTYEELPDIYIADASCAKLVCNSAAMAYYLYHRNISNMLEHFNGRLPRNPAELKRINGEWMSNVPYGRGFSHIQSETTNRLGTFLSSLSFMKVRLKRHARRDERSEKQFYYANPIALQDVEYAISDTLIEFLLNDRDFMQFMLNASLSSISWGYAPVFKQEDSPFPYCGDIRDAMFEPQAKFENVKTALLLWEVSALDLYQIYYKECVKSKSPLWNKEALEEALAYSFIDSKLADSGKTWPTIYSDAVGEVGGIRTALGRAKNILFAKIINEEKDGKVTTTLFEYCYDYMTFDYRSQNVQNRCGSKIAFQETVEDCTFEDCFGLIRNTGVNTSSLLQKMKGLAGFAYENGVQYDYSRNTANDAMSIHSALKFQAQSALQEQDFNIQYYGGFMVFPSGYPVMRVDNASQPLSANIEMLRFSQDEYRALTGDFNPQVSDKLKSRATSNQVAQVANEVAQTKEDNSTVFLFDLAQELLKVLRRVKTNDKELKKNKEVREVLGKALEIQVLDVFAPELDISAGEFLDQVISDIESVELDYMTNDAARLLELIRMAPNQSTQSFYRRRYAAALSVPYSEQRTYWPVNDDGKSYSSDLSEALIENNQFWDTHELAVLPIQNQITHLETHLYRAIGPEGHIASIQKGVDPVEVQKWLQNMLTHSAFHLKELQADSLNLKMFERLSAIWEELNSQLPQIAAVAEQFAAMIQERAAQQGQGQAQQSPEMMKAMEKIQIDRLQAENRMQIARESADFRREEKAKDGELKRKGQEDQQAASLQNLAQSTAIKTVGAIQNVGIKQKAASARA